jgi:putative flippase GtrA
VIQRFSRFCLRLGRILMLTRHVIEKSHRQFLKFALVGAAGFLVDGGTLALVLKTTALDAYSARIIAIAAALSGTWLLNRSVTFGGSRHSLIGEATRYGGVGIAGSILNYGIYSAILLAAPQAGAFIALCIASASVRLFSYSGYSQLVFRAK